jgi:hypothetical protein
MAVLQKEKEDWAALPQGSSAGYIGSGPSSGSSVMVVLRKSWVKLHPPAVSRSGGRKPDIGASCCFARETVGAIV